MDRDRNHHLSWGIKDVEFDEPEETEESSDPVIENLKAKGLPITRENYIRENWGDIPEFWTADHELSLPRSLQDWSWAGPDTYTD